MARSPRIKPENGYFERHHITPSCFCEDVNCSGYKTKKKHTCGLDNPSNKIYLTAREHYVAHQLLTKIYPEHYGLAYAAFRMTQAIKNNHIGRTNNRLYEWLRIRHATKTSEFFKNNKFPNTRGKGFKWYNNGIDHGKFLPGEQPEGWKLGFIQRFNSEETKQKSLSKLKIGQGWNKDNHEWLSGQRLENLMKHVRGVPKPKGFAIGEKNSMFGSTYIWVNDGIKNYRWTKSLEELPSNYKKGMLR